MGLSPKPAFHADYAVCDTLKVGSAFREFFYLEVYGIVALGNAEGYKKLTCWRENRIRYCSIDVHWLGKNGVVPGRYIILKNQMLVELTWSMLQLKILGATTKNQGRQTNK